MTEVEFGTGLKLVSTALRGGFEREFVDLLWSRFKGLNAAIWARACDLLSGHRTTSRLVVLADFSDAAARAVRERDERDRIPAGRSHLCGRPVTFRRAWAIVMDSGPPWLQEIYRRAAAARRGREDADAEHS